ncbi:BPSS1780 family membrane protein [Pusillimonas noertemannii]|uniref:BPSS1780 family membrane protein n=1 Tax=Pusillimonas noertemannii TaxID=305977 RepID=UPI000304BCA0|nr:BPSS1780 family membrane protein [Pusillimonas noertemannii]
MQAATLPFRSGWLWIQEGGRIFRRQPLAMFFWGLLTSLLITVASVIPILGQMALIAATPVLTFITLCACRHISQGRQMLPGMWFEPLRDKSVRRRLFRLGLAYLACCMLAGFIATLPFLDQLSAAVGDGSNIDPSALFDAMLRPLITFAVLYVLISALFWHAPALTGWHGIKLVQALFYSMVACWRNKWPFLLYGLSWGAIFMAVQFSGDMLMSIGLPAGLVQLVMVPVNIVVVAVLYCSFYPTYMSVFGVNYATQQDEQEIEAGD